MVNAVRAVQVVITGCVLLVTTSRAAIAQPKPKPRDDGHIAGSLVDLLDQDGWEQPPALPESPDGQQQQLAPVFGGDGGQGSEAAPRPVAKQLPGAANPQDVADLERLIADRHRLVDGCEFFDLIDRTLKAEQRLGIARASLVQANTAAQKAVADINIARVQNNEAMESRAQANLAAANRAIGQAQGAVQRATQEYQQLWGQLGPKIREFLKLYQAMRQFVVYDRTSPRLAAARNAFKRACDQRGDFHEGRILAAVCEAYVGGHDAAMQHLGRAAFFGQALFFAWPPANDMVLAYLLLGQPDAVNGWVKWVKGIDEKRKTPTRCWLVAMQGVVKCADNQAKEWFERCSRRITATAKKQNRPPVTPAEVAGSWAAFLLTCQKEEFRDVNKAKEILGNLPPQGSWYVAEAAAAVAAAEGRWQEARRDAAVATERGPAVLEEELKAELNAYEQDQIWIRPRPVKPKP